ncbi:YDG domain-containing protein [Luteibacter sp. PPL554]
MNRIYRLCWNAATSQWVAASELAMGRRPAALVSGGARAPRAAAVAAAIGLALGAPGAARAGQTGGQVVGGSGNIQVNGPVTTIHQDSQHLSLNWSTFDIGPNETVNFVQPGRSAIAVNRILGNEASDIQGHLNANGQVWLVNPNGVIFGEHAQVNVGGLVASTLDTPDASLASDTRTFSGPGKGRIVNKGQIHAADGGYVALLGNQVSNQGTVTARLGTVAMGGGSSVTLSFDGNQLVNVQVDRSTLDNLVENRQLVQADGGRVIMTAGARDSLLASAVNNTGVVRAQTVENRDGQIVLLGGMTAGHVNVEGTLDATAPHGGNGGTIETSAAFATIGKARVDAGAARGKAGTWIVDPFDLTIDSNAASTISSSLATTSVTEQTTASGTSGQGTVASGSGTITVAAPISWSNPNTTLTLDAYANIVVNAGITGAGSVVMKAGSSGTGNVTLNAAVSGNAGVTASMPGTFTNNAGANALAVGSGARWLVYAGARSASTGGLTPNFIQYNATNGSTVQGTGNGFLYAQAPTVALGALQGTVEKAYDGTTQAALTGANFNASGLANGDKLATGTGTYASKDAASGIGVTAANNGYTFTDSTGLVPVYGYVVSGGGVSANIGVIDPKQLAIQIVNNPTKTYNGTTTATLTSGNYQMSGVVSGEGISFSQPNSVGYDASDAGARTVTANFVPSNFVAASGTNLANYALPTSATGAGTINKAPVQLSGLIGSDKTYDGTTADALDKSHASIFGVIAADNGNVTLDTSNGSGQFADANVGNGKSVTAVGFQLQGTKASNYALVLQGDITGSINPKALGITGVSALGKVYDGSTLAQLALSNPQLTGVVGGDNVSLSTTNATGQFATRNVGNGIGVTASGFALTGSGTGNYTLVQPTGLSANITPATLSLSITGNPTRTYNGGNNASLATSDVTITGWAQGESGSLTQNAGATYDSVNAGSHTVTAMIEASDFTLGNGTSLSNYTFPTSIAGAGTIARAPLKWTIVGNPSKTYDGTTGVTLGTSNYQVYGFVGGEGASVSQTQGTFASPNAGIQSVSANVSPGDFVPLQGTNLNNYVLPSVISGFGYISKADGSKVSVVIIGRPTRAYDGTTNATFTSTDFQVIGNFPNGEGFTITKTTGSYAGKDVGAQPVSVQLAQSDYQPIGNTNPNNYTPFSTMAYGTGQINPALLTTSIVGSPTKVYDGSTYIALTPSNYQINGFASGEGADIVPSKSVAFDDSNVGNGKTITAQMAITSYTPHSGTDLSNYTLDLQATGTGSVTPAPLTIVGVSAQNKTYDATTSATLNSGGARLIGLVSGDAGNVTLTTSTTGTFDSADAGVRNVAASGFSISGAAAANYALQPLAGLTATIFQRTLTISGISALDKVYDGTTQIALNTSGGTLGGVLSPDNGNVSLDASSATASVRAANVANGLAVTTQGFALGGSRASNYRVDPVTGLTASITPKAITAVIAGNPTKPYDGSNSVTLLASDYSLSGFVNGQGASIPQSSTASYNGVNAGNHVGLQSTLSVSDFVAQAGTNLANYTLPTSASGTLGTITPFVINLQATRVYDGTTGAAASLFTDGNGLVKGVNGERLTLTGTGDLTTKNVGSRWSFADFGTLALGGSNGSSVANYTLTGGIDWVTITPKALTASFSANDKTYDATTAATLSGNATLVGLIGGDDVTLQNPSSARFSDKNVGSGKTVTGVMSVTGNDAGNYSFTQGTATASITAKHATLTATGANKQYDGGVNDAGATVQSSDVIAGDVVTFTPGSAVFGDKNVGNGKTVTVSSVTKSGTDAGNYTFDNTSLSTTANITPRLLNLVGSRVYDSTTTADASSFTNGSIATGVGSETLSLTGSGTTADKNVGTNKAVSLGSLALQDGTNGGAASNYTLNTAKFNITARLLTATFAANNKTYDGTTAAVLQNATLETANGSRGYIAGDAVSLTNPTAGTFDTKMVGTNKTVTGTMGIAGADAGNYAFTNGTALANISQATLTVNAQGSNRVYNGGTGATVTLSGGVAGDRLTFASGGAAYDGKDVGQHTINVTGITVGGADAGNYIQANTTAATTGNITPVVLNLAGTRVYDGTASASASLFGSGGTLTGVNGETVLLGGSGQVANKNVGSNKAFSSLGTLALQDGSNGGLAQNYTLIGGTDTLTITRKALTVLTTPQSRDYDGTRNVTLTGSTLSGNVAGDTLTLGNAGIGTFADKTVGVNKAVTTAFTLGGADAGNYLFTQPTGLMATVNPLAITVTATAANKVYDTGTGATLTSLGSSGVLGGDVVSFAAGGSTFGDANAANGKTVTVTGITASGADAANYTINTTTTAFANITPVVLNLAGTRVYDGTTSASASLFGSNGLLSGIAGQTVQLAGAGQVANKNVGSNKALSSLGTLALQDGGNGGLAQNYTLIGGTDTLTITRKALTVLTTPQSRDYDGTRNVTLTGSTLSGNVAGDALTLGNAGIGTFADKTVGVNKAVTTAFTLGGADAGNYLFTQPTGLMATVNPLAITVTATAANKVYDTGTGATLTSLGSNGVLGSDVVNFAAGGSTFGDANAANGKTVTVTGITASGADAANYTINTTTTAFANITPVVLNLAGTRVYDGTTSASASLFGSNGLLSGIAGQTVQLAGMGQVANKNVGSNKALSSLGTLALQDGGNGGLAQNYTLIGGTETLTITPKAIGLAAVAADKIYDGGTVAVATVTGVGVLAGDDLRFAPGAAAFASPNAGQQVGVGVSGITASGLDVGNYSFGNAATTFAAITPVVLNLGGARAYDGTAGADASLFGANGTLSGIGGETVRLTGRGQVADKNVGTNKAFSSLGSLILQDGGNGGLAQNYTLLGGTDTLSITPKAIVIGATGSDKTYDGNTTASVTVAGQGVVQGDDVRFAPGTATYATPNAATGVAIAVGGITATGADATNYAFASTAATQGDITPVVLNLSGTRVYDATTRADASLFGDRGVLTGVNGETLTLSGAGTLTDKNVGVQKAFATGGLSGLSLTGNGSALAGNYTLVGGVDWLTVTPATLAVLGTQATSRAYDGTRVDPLTGATLSGVLGQDAVVLGHADTGLFADKNVGSGKTVATAMTIDGADVGNYVLRQPDRLVADITPRQIAVTAAGSNKFYDGNRADGVTLASTGVLGGDAVGFTAGNATFADAAAGLAKPVTVTGIRATGADAGNYAVNDMAMTSADIMQNPSQGASGTAVTQIDAVLAPESIATPYGVAQNLSVGQFSGNHKKTRKAVEKNVRRADFTSGLSLQVVDGGVRAPADAMQ